MSSHNTFYFQLLPYPFPCVGSHMLISIIWWLGVIYKGLLAHFFSKHFLQFWKQLVTSEQRWTYTSRLTNLQHVSRPELHARSRKVNRVTEVWISTIEFNVKSPLTSQLHALTSHELTWREDSVSPALQCLKKKPHLNPINPQCTKFISPNNAQR